MSLLAGHDTKPAFFVVLPTPRDFSALEFFSDLELHFHTDPGFSYPEPCPNFDLSSYLEGCRAFLKDNAHIRHILYSHDLAGLLAGILCDKFDLRGPSFESMFLCSHKYYSRQRQKEAIWNVGIDLEDASSYALVDRFPCYLKPASLVLTLFQKQIKDKEDLIYTLEQLRSELPKWSANYQEIFKSFVSHQDYPLAHKQCVVVEELVTDASQHCVEAWSDADGTPHLWAITDANYSSDGNMAIDNYSTPSSLPSKMQATIVQEAFDLARAHQLRSSFWNVELWVKGGKTIITEINGRSASVWENLYQRVYGCSLYRAMTQLAMGKEITNEQRPKTCSDSISTVGAQFHVVSYDVGRGKDFFNFKEAKKINKEIPLEVFITPGTEIRQTRSSGYWLARFECFADSYHSIQKEANAIRKALTSKTYP